MHSHGCNGHGTDHHVDNLPGSQQKKVEDMTRTQQSNQGTLFWGQDCVG